MGIPARVAAIEFAGDEVRVAVVKTGRRLPAVIELQSRIARYGADDDRFEALVEAVDEAVGALESRPAAFVLCAPSMYSVVRMLTIPFKGKRRVSAAVPFELEPYLAFPLEELMVDYTVVSEASGQTEVLAVGVRRPMLQEQLAILSAAGVEAEAADLDAVGLTMLWQAVHRPGKGLSAVLHVRQEGSVIAILNGKSLAFFRSLDAGARQLLERPNAVAREVQNSIRGFLARWRAEGEITELYITGMAWDDEDRERFSQTLRMPVQSEILLEKLKGGEDALSRVERIPVRRPSFAEGPAAPDASAVDAADLDLAREAASVAELAHSTEPMGAGREHNTWEAAIGVGMSAAGGSYAFDFGREHADWTGALRGVVTHLMFSSCLALLVLVAWAFYYYQGSTRNEVAAAKLQQEVDQLTDEVMQLQEQGLAVDMEMFSDKTLIDILLELSKTLAGETVTITDIQVARSGAERGWVTISGEATDVNAFNEAYAKLQESTVFRFESDPQKRLQDNKLIFEITAFRPESSEEAVSE